MCPHVNPRQRMPRSAGAACRQHAPQPDDLAGIVQVGRARPSDETYHSRRDAGHEPAERREELRPLEPHRGADSVIPMNWTSTSTTTTSARSNGVASAGHASSIQPKAASSATAGHWPSRSG